jgi:superfamily II DNA/RNA helicase
MNELTIDECFAALDFERKKSDDFEKRLKTALAQNKKYGVEVATLRQKVVILESKIEKSGITIEAGVSDNDEKNIIIDEVMLNVKKRKDAIELLSVIIQLRNVDRFWRCLKNQSLNSIVTILTGMKTQESFELTLSKIK